MVVSLEQVKNPALSDPDVVARVLAGEKALFEVLVRRHDTRVYRAVRAILRDESEAEDAMQAAWLQAYRHLADFQGTAQFSTWLLRIATNEALGRLRRRSHLAPVDDEPPEEETIMDVRAEDPEERAAAREAVHLVEHAVDRLPVIYRTVFMLREVEQLSTTETAAALGLSDEAVKVRLHRARSLLRSALTEEVDRAAPDAFPFLAPRCERMVQRVMSAIGEPSPGAA
jgi:RNA polymerase sigma-70 factor (ECF subfamily)